MRILALAESDAYLKWAAELVGVAPDTWSAELCLLDSPISPSDEQVTWALSGTGIEPSATCRIGLWGVARHLRATRPDVMLLALTGPSLAAVTMFLSRESRPAVVAGLPGLALPVRRRALRARRDIDVFIAHSRREQHEYARGFATIGAPARVALATLPFARPMGRPTAANDVLFAAQPSVPATAAERRLLLTRLAALAPPAVVVKLRHGEDGKATHHDPAPYRAVWNELVASGDFTGDEIEFRTGSMSAAIADASWLITVSSTAALEAIGAGVPVLIADDLGYRAGLLNEVFAGSGLVAPIARASLESPGTPNRAWAMENYFHPFTENNWTGVVREAVAEPATMSAGLTSHDSAKWRAAARATVRLSMARARRPASK